MRGNGARGGILAGILGLLAAFWFHAPLGAQSLEDRGLFAPQEEPGFGPPGFAEESVTPPAPGPPGGESPGLSRPGPMPFEKRYRKNMVEVPPPGAPATVTPDDFRDPFFLIRGYREETIEALEPGVTLDGVRFHIYGDAPESVEKFYRDSNFSLEDVFGRIRVDNRDQGCQFCHHGIEQISPRHKLECTDCHLGNSGTRNRRRAHRGLVSNPSAPGQAARFCGKCHAAQVAWMETALMTTARGLIDLTRRAWGAAPRDPGNLSPTPPEEDKEAASPQTAPPSPVPGDSPGPDAGRPAEGSQASRLVQDFLDKKCLRCHLASEAPRRAGDYRATGCAACHMVYTNDGITLTRDRAIQRWLRGRKRAQSHRFERQAAAQALQQHRAYPVVHQFTVAVPSVQCEHCHNNNGVGNEFEGLFGRPARPRPTASPVDRRDPVLYGRDHDFLVPDIHREKGMHCIDCHVAAEMKADTGGYANLHEAVQIRCEDCHGTLESAPTGRKLAPSSETSQALVRAARLNPNLARKLKPDATVLVTGAGYLLPHVQRQKGRWVLYSKVNGKAHRIPLLKGQGAPPVAHRVGRHLEKVECHACHARWSANEWGLHALREPGARVDLWKGWNFFDPVLNFLRDPSNPAAPAGEGAMLLWPSVRGTRTGLKGDWSPGVWFSVFAQSDFSEMVLGKNARGRVTVLRPRYQYFLTDRLETENPRPLRSALPQTPEGNPGLVLTPHAPHTIRRIARPCEACHGNSRAVGLGAPFLRRVEEGAAFFQALRETGTPPAEFQLKQILAEDGTPLQTVLPEGARPLTREEARRLMEPSSAYPAARYLDLEEHRLHTLLGRDTFPYDRMHELNQRKYGPPRRVEDLYYDKQTHRFLTHLPETMTLELEEQDGEAVPDTPAEPLPAETAPPHDESTGESLPEGVREFSYDLFGPPPVH